MSAFTRAAWDLTSRLDSRIEVVHRLSNRGVVVTHASRGARKRASQPSGARSASSPSKAT